MLNKSLINALTAGLVLSVCGFVAAQQKSDLAQSDLWLQPAKGGYTVEFVSSGDVSALQFDVKGISITEGQYDCGVGLANSHSATCAINSKGNLRVIVFAMDNAPVPDGTMLFIRNVSSTATRAELLAAARQVAVAPTLGGVLFSDAQATDVTPDHLQ